MLYFISFWGAGQVGDWKNWMSEEMSADFDAAMHNIADLDLCFQFQPPSDPMTLTSHSHISTSEAFTTKAAESEAFATKAASADNQRES